MPHEGDVVSIANIAALGLPFNLPWCHSASSLLPGHTFHSRLSTTLDPWSNDSPFDTVSLERMSLVYQDDGGVATYHSTESELKSTSMEHLSLQFGISIGSPFLGANVTGSYDKDTLNNRDARKQSVRTSFRVGSVLMKGRPHLSTEALVILKHQGGLPAFINRYGDYFIAGYRLGADAAVLLSESQTSWLESERLAVKASARILFAEISYTHEKFFDRCGAGSSIRVSGFNTLDGTSIPISSPEWTHASPELVNMVKQAHSLEMTCVKLPETTTELAQNLGLNHGVGVPRDILPTILKSGLVVEVIMIPTRKLREVVAWSLSTDIIGF